MERIETFEQWQSLKEEFRLQHKDAATNCFLMGPQLKQDISAGLMDAVQGENALALLKREPEFYRCYYYACPPFALNLPKLDRSVVLEQACAPNRTMPPQVRVELENEGFTLLRETLHFERRNLAEVPAEAGVTFATAEDEEWAWQLLCQNFDARMDFMPTKPQLREAIAADNVYVLHSPEDGRCAGMIHASVHGRTALLEHVVMDKAFRGRGLGKPLLYGTLTKLAQQQFVCAELWSGKENHTAHRLYQNCGFTLGSKFSLTFERSV